MGRMASTIVFSFIYLALRMFAKEDTKKQGNALKIQMSLEVSSLSLEPFWFRVVLSGVL